MKQKLSFEGIVRPNGPTAALADFVVNLKCKNLPAAVIDRARVALLDLLSCGLAGAHSAAARSCRSALHRFGGAQHGNVVWGTTEKLSSPWAAMANAIAARVPKMDDIYLGGKLHPGSFVMPALLSAAEDLQREGRTVSGQRAIEAIVAGYEVSARTSQAAGAAEQRLRGWHPTGTCGPIGAAATVSKLLDLDGESTLSALGLGGDQAAGLSLHHSDGSMVGYFHSGHAAMGGLLGAYLAQSGFRGPGEVLAAEDAGLCRALSGQCDVHKLTDQLGERFVLVGTGMKPYASCRSTHGAVHSVIALRREHAFKPDEVRRVVVHTNRIAMMQCRHVVMPPNRVPGGSTSMAYAIAAAICDLDVGPMQLAAERMEQTDVQNLAQHVEMVVDPVFDAAYPQSWPCKVGVELENGRCFERARDNPPWEPEDPVEWGVLVERFHHMAGDVLPEHKINALISQVADLPNLNSLASIFENLAA